MKNKNSVSDFELIKLAVNSGKEENEIISGIIYILAGGDKKKYEAIFKIVSE